MPGLMMPQAKCLISNGIKNITAGTWRAEREEYPGGGRQISTCLPSLRGSHFC